MKNTLTNNRALVRIIDIGFIHRFAWFGILLMGISCKGILVNDKVIPFVILIDRSDPEQYNSFELNCNEINARIGGADFNKRKILVHDLNNDDYLSTQLIDTDNDNQPDYIKVETAISRTEPLRPFELIIAKKEKQAIFLDSLTHEPKSFQINYLKTYADYEKTNVVDGKLAGTIAQTFTGTYQNPADLEIFEPGEWSYTNGFFLNGLCYYDQLTGNDNYLPYVMLWLDYFIDARGEIDTLKYNRNNYRLDDILPGRSLLYAYQKKDDERYLKAANILMDQLKSQPRTSQGGYWHKKKYDWQMWLDGIYMSDVFLLQYAVQTNHPEYIDEAIFQMKVIYKNTSDSVTGLMTHGWDESRSKIWADPVNGKSSQFWGRGMGWYIMALVDALDYIPVENTERTEILKILTNISQALLKYQDSKTGLWYQILDKAEQRGNWPESSCTAMIAYSFLKSYKMGYLPDEYNVAAKKAYDGLKRHFIFFDDNGRLYLTGTVKVGTLNEEVSNGSYDYYVSVDRRINDFKGIAALLYLAEVDELMKNKKP
jgi:unsaturated rhamnogalacturonyl hydrolase